jgi:hypothetical protein
MAEQKHGWRSWLHPGVVAHPNSPCGGGGPGGFRTPSFTLENGTPTGMPAANSPQSRQMDPQSLQGAVCRSQATSAVAEVKRSGHWIDLKVAAQVALGPYSFGLGVCAGLVENPVRGAIGLIELQKTFILADIHDRATRGTSWTGAFPVLGAAIQLGGGLLEAMGLLHQKDLERAFEQREAIKKEVAEIFAHPLVHLSKVPARVKDEYVQEWKRFTTLSSDLHLTSQFEAGEIFGDILMDVAMTIATVAGGVGAATTIAAKAPELMKLGALLRKGRAGAAADGVAAGAVGAATEDAAASRVAAGSAEGPRPGRTSAKPQAGAAERGATTATEEPPAKPGKFKPPVAEDLSKVEVDGVKPVRVRQGTNGKVAVIGRNMKYVEAHGAEYQKLGYDTELFNGEMLPQAARAELERLKSSGTYLSEAEIPESEIFGANQEWAKKLSDEGYTVVDMGNPAAAGPSPFYDMECETIFGGGGL